MMIQLTPAPMVSQPAAPCSAGAASLDSLLEDGEVHVWRAELKHPGVPPRRLLHLLSAAEMRRAQRFRFTPDRERFVVKRALQRLILGRHYLNRPARLLHFYVSGNGKPVVRHDRPMPIHFNTTESDGLWLMAVSAAGEVGIDVERIRPIPEMREISERFFSPADRLELQVLGGLGSGVEAFYKCWTRTEAFLKGTGTGLSAAYMGHQRRAAVPPAEEPTGWTVYPVSVDPGFAAALAVYEVRQVRVRQLDWWPNRLGKA